MTRRALAFGTALAAIVWVAMAVTSPRTAPAGWLVALVFVSAVPLGSLTWMMIHSLTGGHWGNSLRPALALAARTTPLLALFAIPVLIAFSSLYPWVHGSGTTPSVARFYLNVPLFLIRSLIAIAGWSVLTFILSRPNTRRTTQFAATGLAFHALMISLLSVDWMLSVEATFISTSFGATIAITQLLAALAFAALAADPLDDRTTRDLAGLMLASTLGVTYLNFMAVLVMWYGDLPDRVYWFVERIAQPWLAIAIAAFVFASLLPIAALLLARVRRSRAMLRAVGVSILVGIALFDVWLLAPPFGPWSIAAAIPALFTMAGAFALAAGVDWPALASRRLRVGAMTAPDKLSAPGIHTRAVLATAAGILVFLAVTLGGLGWTYYAAVPRQPVLPPRTFPAPELESEPGRQLQQLLVQQRRALSGIDTAMAQIVQRGARAYDPIPAAAAKSGTNP